MRDVSIFNPATDSMRGGTARAIRMHKRKQDAHIHAALRPTGGAIVLVETITAADAVAVIQRIGSCARPVRASSLLVRSPKKRPKERRRDGAVAPRGTHNSTFPSNRDLHVISDSSRRHEAKLDHAADEQPPPAGYVCRLCNVAGHWIDRCPERHGTLCVGQPPNDYVCRLCSVPGHWIQHCPKKKKAQRPAKSELTLTARPTPPPKSNSEMNGIGIRSPLPILRQPKGPDGTAGFARAHRVHPQLMVSG